MLLVMIKIYECLEMEKINYDFFSSDELLFTAFKEILVFLFHYYFYCYYPKFSISAY